MRGERRALALLTLSLAPATAFARPATDTSMAALLARHRLPAGDAAATGRALLVAGDMPAALAAFQQALVEAPESVIARNGLAACYERLGRDDLARQAYEQALVVAPGTALVEANLGGLLVRTGAADAAIPMLQRAAASHDAEIAAAARRLLVQAGAALRNRAIAAQQAALTAPAPVATAEVRLAAGVSIVTPARLRVVTAAAGEVRLDAAAPAPELVASLGDDAALAEPPRPWRAEDEAQVRQAALAIAPQPRSPAAPRRNAPTPAPVVPVPSVAVVAAVTGPAPAPPARRRSADLPVSTSVITVAVPRSRPLQIVGTGPIDPRPMAPRRPGSTEPAAPLPQSTAAYRGVATSIHFVVATAPRRAGPHQSPAFDLAGVVRAWQRFAGYGPRPSAPGGLVGFDTLLRRARA